HLLLAASLFTFSLYFSGDPRDLHSFPTRRSSDLIELAVKLHRYRAGLNERPQAPCVADHVGVHHIRHSVASARRQRTFQSLVDRSEEHTSELQSPCNLVCRLLLEKKKKTI